MGSLTGKTAIVTGSNSGIGKETARGLLMRGATVVLACRDLKKGKDARSELIASTGRDIVEVMELELSNKKQIAEFVSAFSAKHSRLDMLVNNAGVWMTERQVTADGFEMSFGVNHLGTFALTNALIPLLKSSAPSRVVVVSSGLHFKATINFDDLQQEKAQPFDGGFAYRQSKLANVLFTNALARRLEGTGVTANSLHPGVVSTQLWRHMKSGAPSPARMINPMQGAGCSLFVATAGSLKTVTGKYFEKSQERPPSQLAMDQTAQEKLWAVSEQLLEAKS